MTRTEFIKAIEVLGNYKVVDFYEHSELIRKTWSKNAWAIVIDYDADTETMYKIAYKYSTMKQPDICLKEYAYAEIKEEIAREMFHLTDAKYNTRGK